MNSTLIIFILVPQLQSLMADAMDTLEGRRNDEERVWNTIQKVTLSAEGKEDMLFSKKISIWGQLCLKMKRKGSSLAFLFFFLLYNTVLVLPYIDTNPPHGSLFKTNAAVSGSITKMKCGHLFNLVLQVCCISDCGPVLLGSLIMLVFMLYFHYLLLHYWLLYIFKAPSSMFQFAPQPFLL